MALTLTHVRRQNRRGRWKGARKEAKQRGKVKGEHVRILQVRRTGDADYVRQNGASQCFSYEKHFLMFWMMFIWFLGFACHLFKNIDFVLIFCLVLFGKNFMCMIMYFCMMFCMMFIWFLGFACHLVKICNFLLVWSSTFRELLMFFHYFVM